MWCCIYIWIVKRFYKPNINIRWYTIPIDAIAAAKRTHGSNLVIRTTNAYTPIHRPTTIIPYNTYTRYTIMAKYDFDKTWQRAPNVPKGESWTQTIGYRKSKINTYRLYRRMWISQFEYVGMERLVRDC